MEATKITIQQLLRPTETCKFIVKGHHLGIQSHDDRLLCIIQHEGTKEQALFVFNVDSLGLLVINKLIPIKGSFAASLQSNTPAGCNVAINTPDGEVLVFRLPYDSVTAKLFGLLTTAMDGYVKSPSVNSPSSFDWLRGYEGCRTGWDRFCKPRSNTSPAPEYRESLPEDWPWGHIITPHPDGNMDVAMCESLIDEFDPLRSQSNSVSHPNSVHTSKLQRGSLDISRPRPSPTRTNHPLDPATLKKSGNQFLSLPDATPIRSSHSDSNISKLGLSIPATINSPSMQSTRSQLVLNEKRKGFVHLSPEGSEGTSPKESPYRIVPRPQGSGLRQDSTTTPMGNPFLEGTDQNQQDSSEEARFWLEKCELDIELKKVDKEQKRKQQDEKTSGGSGMGNRTASLDVLHKRGSDKGGGTTQEVLDYSHRRMRTPTRSSPQISQISSHPFTQSMDCMSETPSILPPTRSKTGTVGISKAVSRSPKLFRKKRSPRHASPSSKTAWVTRYQPGVLLLKGSMRECLIQRMLHDKESEFCEYVNLRIFCGTWNVNGQMPIQRLDKWLLNNREVPDIFAIGFQELDLSTEALLNKDSKREEMWLELVESSLSLVGLKYKRLAFQRLVGILLVVYVEETLIPYVTDVDSDVVPCGIMGHLGNKGGVAIRFNIHHSSICIVNSHLAAHLEEVEKRNQDYHQIFSRLQFFKNSQLPYTIMEHNMVIWMGDLNYRLQAPPALTVDAIKAYSDTYQFHKLLPLDQLHIQQKGGHVFTQFHENRIDFKPTYKYDPSTNEWDTSEKNRAPAWCDRILYYSQGDLLEGLDYSSYPEMIISDHKPVSCLFNSKVKVVVPDKEKDILEQITRKLDKQENETLPQVELNCLEFKFEDVKFMVKKRRPLRVRNIGQRPVQVSFLATPDKQDEISKPWLTVKPDRAIILIGEEQVFYLTMLVDSEISPLLQSKKEKLEDILVLHLEGGKDFFISVVGEYLTSSFGASLDTLIHIHTNIRDVPTADLLELSSSWEEYDSNGLEKRTSPPPLDIPKELYRLVKYLELYGLRTENLFTDGGLTNEQEKIREIIDSGGSKMVGGVYSVAATLLLFLRSLSEPVVPRTLHQKCMEGCNNSTLCRQLLLQMPQVHRRTFAYLITFLKNLLQYSHENQLDAKLLASIFGEVLLNTNREARLMQTKKSLQHMNKKKATFVWQFLVNDLIVDYR